MHSVIETPVFTRRCDDLLTREEKAELVTVLAETLAQVIWFRAWVASARCGLRFAAGGQGKRGAFRVIWYVLTDDLPVFALLIYGKGEQANPSPEQRKAMLAVVERLKRDAAGRRLKEG